MRNIGPETLRAIGQSLWLDPATIEACAAAWEADQAAVAAIGLWPADDLRRAFVIGAVWWEWHSQGATMWPSDRDLAEAEAQRRYPGGKPPSAGRGDDDTV